MQGRDYLRALTRTPVPKELAFPLAEYQARVERVRARMAAAGLDLLLVTHPPNLCYLTGYSTFAVGRHACLLLPARGELVLQVSAMAIPAAVLTGWVEHVEPYDWNEVDRIPERIAALVRAQGLERARTGLELARLPAQTHADVRRHLPGATFEDASGLVMGVRLIKSAAELDCMRRAARMTLAGVEASYRAIAPERYRQRRGAGRLRCNGGRRKRVPVGRPHRHRRAPLGMGTHLLQAECAEGGRRGVPRIRRAATSGTPRPSCGPP